MARCGCQGYDQDGSEGLESLDFRREAPVWMDMITPLGLLVVR